MQCQNGESWDERTQSCVRQLCTELISPVVGDTCIFGRYIQTLDGKESDLVWQIINVNFDGTILLITKDVIDMIPYHTHNEDVTWSTSFIRSWLNGLGPDANLVSLDCSSDNFMKTAFNSDERDHILKIYGNKNPDNIFKNDYNSWAASGGDTTDEVFLLSLDEASMYFEDDAVRKALPTEYVKDQICHFNGSDYCINASVIYAPYWLRSPGGNNVKASMVNGNGKTNNFGNPVDTLEGLRPALYLHP